MAIFDPMSFSIPETAPTLIGGIGQGGVTEAFVAEFGTRWMRTPVKGVYICGSNTREHSFTIRGRDIAYYNATLNETKKSYDETKSFGDAMYFPVDDTYKYIGIQLLKIIRDQEELDARWASYQEGGE